MKNFLGLISTVALVAACSEIPPQAYYNRGDPENLLDVSSEVVNLNLSTRTSLSQLTSTVTQDPPSRAELNCQASDMICGQAREILERHNVPTRMTGNSGGVTLVYERVTARDCENRYIDNSINPYNLNHPTFGCSIAGNTVQMVSDKHQFTNPALLDLTDGEKSVQAYHAYLKPTDGNAKSSASTLGSVSAVAR